jgi:hypothetical protein
MNQKKPWLKRVVTALEVGVVLVEINPVSSESIRFGVLFGVQAAFNNVAISAASFGTITFVGDIIGIVAIIDLFNTKAAAKTLDRVNVLVTKLGLSWLFNVKTNFVTDLGITLLTGTPAAILLKHRQNPMRSNTENRQLGYRLSLAAAVVATAQGAALIAGIWHPNPITIAIALVTIASVIALHKWIIKHIENVVKQKKKSS